MPNLDRNRLPLKDYFEWRKGNLTSLLNVPPTQVNGLSLIPHANPVSYTHLTLPTKA